MEPVRIQRKRSKGFRLPANTISVCRPGKWGNPFAVGKDNPLGRNPIDNEGAVGFFKEMLYDPELRLIAQYPSDLEIRNTLKGKNLACFCALNQHCHADVLLKVANS